ncbi:hypothetical protein CPT_Sonora_095 [Stenotrophomonas phage Sonora]|nr:hypothetical protein CPT_Sonora_095 [Stenotrophomonas phage Sonora]
MARKAALRDCSWYERPGTGSKYHALVERDVDRGYGPACGYPFYTEGTEQDAAGTPKHARCGRPGCLKAFAEADADKEIGL